MKLYYILFLLVLSTVLVSAQFGYDNEGIPRINSERVDTVIAGNFTFNQTLGDELYIRQDGTSTTSAQIPFAEGILSSKKIVLDGAFAEGDIKFEGIFGGDIIFDTVIGSYASGIYWGADDSRDLGDNYLFFNPSPFFELQMVGNKIKIQSNNSIVLDSPLVQIPNYDQQLAFGNSTDTRIWHNGTDFIIDPNIVGDGSVYIGGVGDDQIFASNLNVPSGNLKNLGRDVCLNDSTNCPSSTNETWLNDTFVNEAGDTMTGQLIVPSLNVLGNATLSNSQNFLNSTGDIYITIGGTDTEGWIKFVG